MDPYVIYAFYNADQVQGVLNAIVMLMGSGGVDGDYLSLIRIAAMLGLFVAVAVGFLRARGEDAGMYLVMMALFYSVLFLPRVTVTIEDVGFAAGAPRTVANVPIGLAFFASTTSKIGYWLTDRTETVFAFPDENIGFKKGGMMGASRALRESQGASFTEPILAQDMQLFMRDCVNPEILVNPPTLTSLMASRTIWADFNTLGLINPGRIVSLASQPAAVNCGDAYTAILGPRIAAQVVSERSRIARILSPFVPPATAETTIGTLLPAAEGMVMTASATAAEAIQQRMMINMLNDTSQTLGQVMNDPTAVQNAVAAAQASQAANSSYRIMAKLAAETLPMIRNALELVIMGVFPFMLVLVIVAGAKGGIVLRSYVMAMLWVQLWAPLYAIVNYVGTMTSAKRLTGALEGIDGVTVQNAAQVLNTTISGEAVVGLLTISVPIIALALVKGGEMAMTGVVSGLMGPAQHSADKTGQAVGSGNVSAGNVQWGNYSAHSASVGKYDTDFKSMGGAFTSRDGGGMAETQYRGGTTTLSQPKHDTTLGGQNMASFGSELSSQAARSTQAAFGNIRAASEQQNAVFGEMVNQMKTGGLGNSNAIGLSRREAGSLNQQYGGDRQTSTLVNESAGSAQNITAINQGRFNAAANAGADLQAGSSAGVTEQAGRSTTQPVTGQSPSTGQPRSVDQHGQTGRQAASASGGNKVGFSIGGAMAIMQNYESGINKAISRGDGATASRLSSERQGYLNELAQTSGFTSTAQGETKNGQGADARLSKASTHLDQAQAQLQQASRLEESSRVLRSASASATHNALSDPRMFSAGEQRQILSDLANAKTPEARAAVLEQLAQRIGGAQLGAEHAKSHLSGEKVLGTEGAIQGEHAENIKDPSVQNRTAEAHKENTAKVPKGAVGAESVSPQQGLRSSVEGFIAQSKDGSQSEAARIGNVLQQGLTKVQGETGFTNMGGSDMTSTKKTANVASDMMTADMGSSLRQLMPNSVSGSMPTHEQHQAALGYDPANPQAARPAAASPAVGATPQSPDAFNNQSSRPQAPEGWQPSIPQRREPAATP